jgi:Zn-dependent M28 family amino/carboxypeptidase
LPNLGKRLKEGEEDIFQKEILRSNLYKHVEYLSSKIGERNLWKDDSLNRALNYIESIFISYGYKVWRQTYLCYGRYVSNLITEKPGSEKEIIVIGAHYDTVPGTPGADDNASAVAVLLELARLHQGVKTKRTIVFSAFVNEEPPFFGSPYMGSMVYARHLEERRIPVKVMISLEMVGYFREETIQSYPLQFMAFFYPKKADYIGVVGNFRSFKYVSLFKKGIGRNSSIKSRSLVAPEFFGGINLSDNYSFWHHGYRAIMVTDTSFFRNKNYHQETDTIDTLNFDKMSELVNGLYKTLLEF